MLTHAYEYTTLFHDIANTLLALAFLQLACVV
jgi:hypothetical protein